MSKRRRDVRDAEAIAEAATRPAMRFVVEAQLDMQSLHGARDRLVSIKCDITFWSKAASILSSQAGSIGIRLDCHHRHAATTQHEGAKWQHDS
jgi:hypothetical protein